MEVVGTKQWGNDSSGQWHKTVEYLLELTIQEEVEDLFKFMTMTNYRTGKLDVFFFHSECYFEIIKIK